LSILFTKNNPPLQLWFHKIHHNPNLGRVTNLLLMLYFVMINRGCIEVTTKIWNSKMEIPKFLNFAKLCIVQLCECITLTYKLWLKKIQRKSYNPWRIFRNTTRIHGFFYKENYFFLNQKMSMCNLTNS
jgi:hypothetical protein